MGNKTPKGDWLSMDVPKALATSILSGKTTLPDGKIMVPFAYNLIGDTPRYQIFFFIQDQE